MGYNYAFESLVNSSSGKTKNHYSCDCDCLRALLIQVVVKLLSVFKHTFPV